MAIVYRRCEHCGALIYRRAVVVGGPRGTDAHLGRFFCCPACAEAHARGEPRPSAPHTHPT